MAIVLIATIFDAAGALRLLPRMPVLSYALCGLVIGAGSLIVLARTLRARSGRPARGTGLLMLALALLLGAWLLRGHPEIPPDPPLVAAQLAAALLLAAAAWRTPAPHPPSPSPTS